MLQKELSAVTGAPGQRCNTKEQLNQRGNGVGSDLPQFELDIKETKKKEF